MRTRNGRRLTLTRASYEQFWDQSVEQFSGVLATDNPDLSAFKARGGKIVMWHGQSDPLIYPGGSIDYYTRVQKAMGGADEDIGVLSVCFSRLASATAAAARDPRRSGQFEAVVQWVEEGKAPDTLDAVRRDQSGATTRSRVLCPYPATAQLQGQREHRRGAQLRVPDKVDQEH